MKLDRLAIIDCEWAPSCHLYSTPNQGSVDLIEWAVINMDFDPQVGWRESARVQGVVQYLGTLPSRIQKLTGICPHELKSARPFDEWADTIELFTRGRVLVGHHIEQDYKVLQEHFQRVGKPYKREVFCTLKEAKKQYPGLASYELNELAHLFDLPHDQHHRAESDAQVTWMLYEKWRTPTLQKCEEAKRHTDELKDFPWLAHESREKYRLLPRRPGIISFYSHKKLLHIHDCLDLKKQAAAELKKLIDSSLPLTHIKFSSHPHLLVNQAQTLELIQKFSPPLSLERMKADQCFGLSCFKDKLGLLSLKMVRYKKENHHRYIDFAQDKKEALQIIKKIEAQFSELPTYAYIDPEELKLIYERANKDRQQVINLWKKRFCEKYSLAQKTLELKENGQMLITEATQKGPITKMIRPHIQQILNLRKLRYEFQKQLSAHSLHDGHNQHSVSL